MSAAPLNHQPQAGCGLWTGYCTHAARSRNCVRISQTVILPNQHKSQLVRRKSSGKRPAIASRNSTRVCEMVSRPRRTAAHTAFHRLTSPPRPPSPPFLQADVEDDAAPAKRPTRKFKNLDKPWEDDSVDHWKQHSQGFTQCGNAGHGGRKIHLPPSGAWWLRAGSRPAGAPVGAAGTPVQPYALCLWRAGTSPSPRRT